MRKKIRNKQPNLGEDRKDAARIRRRISAYEELIKNPKNGIESRFIGGYHRPGSAS